MTLHIKVSERTKRALELLATKDRRKLSPYIGVVLDMHVEAALASGEVRLAEAEKPKGGRKP